MSFSIDKVYLINQSIRADRLYGTMFSLYQFKVPYAKFERFPARCENNNLPNSLTELLLMIRNDGFSCYNKLLEPGVIEQRLLASESAERNLHPASIASVWSKLSLLRHIADRNENALFITDSFMLSGSSIIKHFNRLVRVCEKLDAFKWLLLFSNSKKLNAPFTRSSIDGIFGPPNGVNGFSVFVTTPAACSDILNFVNSDDKILDHVFNVIPNMLKDGIDLTGYYFCESNVATPYRSGELGYTFTYHDKIVARDSLPYPNNTLDSSLSDVAFPEYDKLLNP